MSGRHGVTAAEFRRVCGRFATGITVASVLDSAGTPHGLTVNSFTSVSLAPPLILICLDHKASVIDYFRAASHFAVSVLSDQQQALSDHFARKGQNRFDGIAWHAGRTGVPLITGAIATFECAAYQRVTAGDHDIFVGEVLHLERHEHAAPLLYFGGKYGRLG